MEIHVARFVRFQNEGALQAFCDIAVGEFVLIKGIRVIDGRTGPFVSMPRQHSGGGKWYDSVVFLDGDVRAEVTRLVLEAYQKSEQLRLKCAAKAGD